MDEQLTAAWILTNERLWPKLSGVRRNEIKTWLEMNGINPSLVPVDGTISIRVVGPETDSENWVIRYEEFCTDPEGHILAGDEGNAYTHVREIPLVIDPPLLWLIPA